MYEAWKQSSSEEFCKVCLFVELFYDLVVTSSGWTCRSRGHWHRLPKRLIDHMVPQHYPLHCRSSVLARRSRDPAAWRSHRYVWSLREFVAIFSIRLVQCPADSRAQTISRAILCQQMSSCGFATFANTRMRRDDTQPLARRSTISYYRSSLPSGCTAEGCILVTPPLFLLPCFPRPPLRELLLTCAIFTWRTWVTEIERTYPEIHERPARHARMLNARFFRGCC